MEDLKRLHKGAAPMAIESSKSRKGNIIRGSSSRKAPKYGYVKFIIAILIIIPAIFMFTNPSARASFFDYQIGKGFERLKNYPEAKQYYGAAWANSNKTHLQARLKYAEMCNLTGQYDEALTVTQSMIDFGITNELLLSEVWRQNGDANMGLAIYDDAIVSYSAASKLNGNNYYALVGLGRAYRLKGDYPKSIDFLNNAINIRELRSPEAHYELGMTYLAQNNGADALDQFDLVLRQMASRDLREKAREQKINIIANRQ